MVCLVQKGLICSNVHVWVSIFTNSSTIRVGKHPSTLPFNSERSFKKPSRFIELTLALRFILCGISHTRSPQWWTQKFVLYCDSSCSLCRVDVLRTSVERKNLVNIVGVYLKRFHCLLWKYFLDHEARVCLINLFVLADGLRKL